MAEEKKKSQEVQPAFPTPPHHGEPKEEECEKQHKCKCCNVTVEQHCPPQSCCCSCAPKVETCTFEIYMTRLKVDLVKGEVGEKKAELMVTGYADGRSAVFPGNGMWVEVHPSWGWRTINKLVTTVTVAKGTSRVVTVYADAIEAGGLGELSWEFGSAEVIKYLTLQCGKQVGADYVTVAMKKTANFSNQKKVMAMITIEFMAFQVTP